MTIFSPIDLPPPLTQRPLVAETAGNHTVEYRPSFDAWFEISRAYWEAGWVLVDRVKRDPSSSARLLPPALFIIRHSVELQLKSLVLDARVDRRQDEAPDEQRMLNGHSLDDLWQLLQRRLSRVGGAHQSARWDRTADIVRQLSLLDHSSFEFRYPNNKKGGPTASTTGVRIDLEQFGDVLKELRFILDSTSAWLFDLPRGDTP